MPTELDELVAMTATPADQQLLREILGRAPRLSTQLDTSQAVFKAFVEGDDIQVDAAIAAAKIKSDATAAAATRRTAQTSAAAIDMNELAELVNKSAETKFKTLIDSEDYKKSEEARIKATIKAVTDELGPQLLSNAARSADEIYQVRRSHEKEFGSELDTNKLVEFMNAPENAGKFSTLAKCHDAFVHDERVKKEIDKGVAEGIKAHEDKEVIVPGQTLATGSSVLSKMVQANKLTVGETARGPALDAAARAFRSLQSQRAE
jgi:hypothetical protein